MPNSATERQIEELEINPDNLDIEDDENENVGVQIPQEELDEVSVIYLIWRKSKKNGTGTEFPVAMTVLPKGLPWMNLAPWGCCCNNKNWSHLKRKQR